MIRLTYSLFEKPIELCENTVKVIVLENPKAFREFISELKNAFSGIESKVVFSKDYEELTLLKNFELIIDILSLDMNNKKILNKISSLLQETAISPEYYSSTLDILGQLNAYLSNLTQNTHYSLSFTDIDITSLLKAAKVQTDICTQGFLEGICEYTLLLNEYLDINIFVFIGLKMFLTNEELLDFYNFANYKKLRLILVENQIKESLNNEHITIIDNDLCCII